MDDAQFEYLTILVSLILGLGVADLLQSAYRLVQMHDHVRFDWVSPVWAVIVFLRTGFFFWDFYAFGHAAVWGSFPAFLYLLTSPILLFLAACNVLPDALPESYDARDRFDLRAYYFDRPRGFFAILTLLSISDLGIALLLGAPLLDVRPILFMAEMPLFAALAWSRNVAFHKTATLTLLVITLFSVFVVQGKLG